MRHGLTCPQCDWRGHRPLLLLPDEIKCELQFATLLLPTGVVLIIGLFALATMVRSCAWWFIIGVLIALPAGLSLIYIGLMNMRKLRAHGASVTRDRLHKTTISSTRWGHAYSAHFARHGSLDCSEAFFKQAPINTTYEIIYSPHIRQIWSARQIELASKEDHA